MVDRGIPLEKLQMSSTFPAAAVVQCLNFSTFSSSILSATRLSAEAVAPVTATISGHAPWIEVMAQLSSALQPFLLRNRLLEEVLLLSLFFLILWLVGTPKWTQDYASIDPR